MYRNFDKQLLVQVKVTMSSASIADPAELIPFSDSVWMDDILRQGILT